MRPIVYYNTIIRSFSTKNCYIPNQLVEVNPFKELTSQIAGGFSYKVISFMFEHEKKNINMIKNLYIN